MRLLVLIFVGYFIVGCATIKVPQATGGSKSDGIVELSYEYGSFQKPVVQWDQALITAKQRCNAWGYPNVEKFGGSTSKCQSHDAYGSCTQHFVTIKYQCMGSN